MVLYDDRNRRNAMISSEGRADSVELGALLPTPSGSSTPLQIRGSSPSLCAPLSHVQA